MGSLAPEYRRIEIDTTEMVTRNLKTKAMSQVREVRSPISGLSAGLSLTDPQGWIFHRKAGLGRVQSSITWRLAP